MLQRRFNFFDYAADGNLNGSVTISQLNMLSHNLLPSPDSFVIVDRQRASANGYLINPTAQRNYTDLQHILPQYQWVPKSALTRYRNISPAQFKVDRGVQPGTTFPLYTLYDGPITRTGKVVTNIPASTSSTSVVIKPTGQSAPKAPTNSQSTAAKAALSGLTSAPVNQASSSTATNSSGTTPSTIALAQAAGIPIPNASAVNPTAGTNAAATPVTAVTGQANSASNPTVVIPAATLALPTTTTQPKPAVTTTASTTATSSTSNSSTATASKSSTSSTAKKVVASTKSKGFFNNVSSSFKKIFG